MKILFFVLSLFVFATSPLHAQGEPLRVAVDSYTPPFVMAGNKQLYGFDISMMEYICHAIQRTCQFIPTPFDEILNAVQTKKVDVAVSSITITAERAAIVNFSLPYLLSYARFIGPSKLADQQFGLHLLNERKIGVIEATIFSDVIKIMGVRNPRIVSFRVLTTMIDALNGGKIDVALMDAPSAMYWQAQSSGKLKVLGEPFTYGFGLGIAVNREETDLLQAINRALLQYQNSEEFKGDFNKYLAHF